MRWYPPLMINGSGHHRQITLATDSEISRVKHKSRARFFTHLINCILVWFDCWVSEPHCILICSFHETRWRLNRNGARARLLAGRSHHVFLGYSFLLHKQYSTCKPGNSWSTHASCWPSNLNYMHMQVRACVRARARVRVRVRVCVCKQSNSSGKTLPYTLQ